MVAREVLNVRLIPLLNQTAVKIADTIKPPKSSPPNPYTYIRIVFTDQGRELITQISRKYIGKRIALVIGRQVMMAPYIKTEITSGSFAIAGRHTEEEAKSLAKTINDAVKTSRAKEPSHDGWTPLVLPNQNKPNAVSK